MKRTATLLCTFLLLLGPTCVFAGFRAGAAVVDVTPQQLPVLVNGSMLSRSVDKVKTRLSARAIVLDDGSERLAIVVVDSCMMPRPLLDQAKSLAAQRTTIRADQMLVSATHTHTAPSCMACLGTDSDPNYMPFLRERIAAAIAAAETNLEPAQVGWAQVNAEQFTALRRWVRRPDRIAEDPFGNLTVRANMHAASNWDDVTGPSGPEDPDLSILSLQTENGRPIAVLANFSMHYFGDEPLSADYFGLFCEGFESRLATTGGSGHPPFVAIMSHNCSGDIWRRDYTHPIPTGAENLTIQSYASGLLELAQQAYATIAHKPQCPLAMSETRMRLNYRVPNTQLLQWARRIVTAMGDRPPKDTKEVYAREQVILHERQSTEIVVQALRIGDIGIVTTPTETYALTGLKLKAQSPLPKTMVIELANGGDGYIPPPEQHGLGGYNTWPARSAGLEVQAEPRIVEAGLHLLEEVTGLARRHYRQSCGSAGEAILEAEPVAYWRMDEFAGPRAVDRSRHRGDALYEKGIVFFLEGPRSDAFCRHGEKNRAAFFAGGRLNARIANLDDHYSISLWFWNGMPATARKITGWMFSRGRDFGLGHHGDHLGIGGAGDHSGKLIFLHGADTGRAKLITGRTEIKRWSWYHVLFVRDGESVRVHLNGISRPEIETRSTASFPAAFDQMFFGGRGDNQSNWEGRLDEIAVFDRALTREEIDQLSVK